MQVGDARENAMLTLVGAECMTFSEIRTVKMKNGTGQGTALGPALCSLFFLPLLLLWVSNGNNSGRISRPGP
jgi:hypothetical protein